MTPEQKVKLYYPQARCSEIMIVKLHPYWGVWPKRVYEIVLDLYGTFTADTPEQAWINAAENMYIPPAAERVYLRYHYSRSKSIVNRLIYSYEQQTEMPTHR